MFERSNCIEKGFRVNRWCPCTDDQNPECIWRFTLLFRITVRSTSYDRSYP